MRVGLLWRAEWDPFDTGAAVENCKLHGVFAAFAALEVDAEPVVYSDDAIDSVRSQLLGPDGVLVWVNPIEHGLDRAKLDPLLREAADRRRLGQRAPRRDSAHGYQGGARRDQAT